MNENIIDLTIDDILEESEGFLNKPYLDYYFKLEGRNDELNLLKESLYKKRLKNTILVGNPGCGKTAILEEFAKLNNDKCIVLENMGKHKEECKKGLKLNKLTLGFVI